jgi:choline dehydrogenase-like flavoprotein
VIVLGGGSLGATLAVELLRADHGRHHRVLVLEAGPLFLNRHVQSPGGARCEPPVPTLLSALQAAGREAVPRNAVWGLPWHSDVPFTGLANCVGGRSLFWGGWSPEPLPEEMPAGVGPGLWPAATVHELSTTYVPRASRLLGAESANEHFDAGLQATLRERLAAAVTSSEVTHAVPLPALPVPAAVRELPQPPARADLLRLLRLPPMTDLTTDALVNLLKLEAPLAVKHAAGTGATSKFSSVALLDPQVPLRALDPSGTSQRLTVVAGCRVVDLSHERGYVRRVDTTSGAIDVGPSTAVVLALGTIENTRLSLASFPVSALAGTNLTSHLGANLLVKLPARGWLPPPCRPSVAAGFVRCRDAPGKDRGTHFHVQVTAATATALASPGSPDPFCVIPDIDVTHSLGVVAAEDLVVSLRAIGEMEPLNPLSQVRLHSERDREGRRRAFVSIEPSRRDRDVLAAMESTLRELVRALAAGRPYRLIEPRVPRGVVGHHEAGTLPMGEDPASSVTDSHGRFHCMGNAYALGPATFPRIGSAGPMLPGVAMAMRLAAHLTAAASR